MTVAVIGGGWAGLAAAVQAVDAGHTVTVYEAAHQLGGRARTVVRPWPDGQGGVQPLALDNGQHILIGAYHATWALMRRLGIDPLTVCERLPLTLRFADGTGLALPDWSQDWRGRWPGLDAAWGIARARGWPWSERLALLRTALHWRHTGFRCAPGLTVAQLCAGLPPGLIARFIEPLCVSALNTPIDEACATVFLRVLRDSLLGERQGTLLPANLMLPRRALGALWCDTAAQWLRTRGVTLRLGHAVSTLTPGDPGCGSRWQVEGAPFDAVIVATGAAPAARLVGGTGPAGRAWQALADGLQHEAITTVYARVLAPAGQPGPWLPAPMLALRPGPGQPAQFVFERDRLVAADQPSQALAFVVSASRLERDAIAHGVVVQAREQLGLAVEPLHVLTDKRATFRCTPGLQRPPVAIAPGLVACGDHVAGPYPATLEGAVRSAALAVAALD